MAKRKTRPATPAEATRKTKAAAVKARKAKAKVTFDAKVKARHTEAEKKLKPKAKEINVLLAKSQQSKAKSEDQRLAAALLLAWAKAFCEKNTMFFKPWLKANIDRSYGDANRLAIAGATENPEEAVAAIRDDNTARRKKSQAKLRDNRGNGGTPATPTEEITPLARATNSVAALGDRGALNLAVDIAAEQGMSVISKHDHTELKDLRKAQQAVAKMSLERVKHDFDGLVASEKMDLVTYAAKKVGVEIVAPSFDPVADRPANLDRQPKNSKSLAKKARSTSPKTRNSRTITRGAVA